LGAATNAVKRITVGAFFTLQLFSSWLQWKKAVIAINSIEPVSLWLFKTIYYPGSQY
jgi:hypothetical protein